MIKRAIPGAGNMTAAQLNQAGLGSVKLNQDQGGKCVWMNSFVIGQGTFCVYAAETLEDVKCHAEHLTPDAPFEIEKIFGTMDMTGVCLRSDDVQRQ
jgi:hypothetical protein